MDWLRSTRRGAGAWPSLVVWASGLLGIGAIGGFDYASGTELRVYPLYYGPIALMAWHSGRGAGVAAAGLSAASWLYFNWLAGLQYTSGSILIANTAVNGASFLLVAWLIAILRQALSDMLELSRTDSLTTLRNARAFYEDAIPLLALCHRTKRPVTLAYLDLDRFKFINDTFGHQAGDALLKAVGMALREALRPSDLCARLGGDEFAVLLPELGEPEIDVALGRVRELVLRAADGATGVTVSIGAVTFLVSPLNLELLVQQADALMYNAKEAGRNRIARAVITADVLPILQAHPQPS